MPEKTVRSIAVFILLSAALLKVVVFFQNRSLFIDEANLGRNIVEKSYQALFGPLGYEQFAPPLYTCAVKGCTQLLGAGEYGLRLFSIVLGLAGLWLFYQILQKLFDGLPLIYPLLLFCFSVYLLRYQTECKQYSADVFFALLCWYLCWLFPFTTYRHYLIMGLVGVVGIWFSMPLVFVLLGVGGGLLYRQVGWRGFKINNRAQLAYSLLAIGGWLLSFGMFYYFNLRKGLQSDFLRDYHARSFLALPTSVTNIQQSYDVLTGLLTSLVGHTVVQQLWAAGCMAIGMRFLIKKDVGKSLLLLLPIIGCFLASLLHQYILLPRLCLFLMPAFYLFIGLGAAVLYKKAIAFRGATKYISLFLMLIPVVLTLAGKSGIPFFLEKYELEEPRPLLQKLAAHPDRSLPLYVTYGGVPAFDFYTRLYVPNIKIPTSGSMYGTWPGKLVPLRQEWKGRGVSRLWIFDCHTYGEELERLKMEIGQIGRVDTVLQARNASCYLVTLN